MIDSIRGRLTLWHTAVVGLLLIVFAFAAYLFLRQTAARRAEEYLSGSASDFVANLTAARNAPSDSSRIFKSVSQFRVRDLAVAVFDVHGKLVALSDPAALSARVKPGESGVPEVQEDALSLSALTTAVAGIPHSPSPVTFTLPSSDGGYRVSLTRVPISRVAYRVAVIQSRQAEADSLEDARIAYLIAIPVILLAAGVGGAFLAKRSLGPVDAMSAQAARISAANLHERLLVVNPRDELGRLAIVINELLFRVEQAFEQQRQFMADASHELRTPVAIVRAEADVALSVVNRPAGAYRESLQVVSGAAERLSSIVNELFLLARADAGQQPLRVTEFPLDELLNECARSVRALAQHHNVTIKVAAYVRAPFKGDVDLLRRLFTNLLDNAIKYSGHGAVVMVSLSAAAPRYLIAVRDTGPGITSDAQKHLFERFFRGDVVRSPTAGGSGLQSGGAGLGLAIAKWIAEAHGGELVLAESSTTGSEFRIWLPQAGAPEAAGDHRERL